MAAILIALAFFLSIEPQPQGAHAYGVGSPNKSAPELSASDTRREADATVTIANLTRVLAIISAVEGILLFWQGFQMKRAAIATAEAANAAVASADALPAIERAYMFLTGLGGVENFPGRIEDTIMNRIGISIENLGKTPAVLRGFRCGLVAPEGRLPVRDDLFAEEFTRDLPGRRVVAAGFPFNPQSVPVPFSGEYLPALASLVAMKRAFMIGLLEYEDVFGVPNETCFCWSFDWRSETFVEAEDVPELNYTRAFPARERGQG